MKKNNTMHWNVDGYDGKVSYQNEGMKPQREFADDKEARADQSHQLRKQLIFLEDIDGGESYDIRNDTQRKRALDTIKVITEIGKWHHTLTKENNPNDDQVTVFKPSRGNVNSERVVKRQNEEDAQLAFFYQRSDEEKTRWQETRGR